MFRITDLPQWDAVRLPKWSNWLDGLVPDKGGQISSDTVLVISREAAKAQSPKVAKSQNGLDKVRKGFTVSARAGRPNALDLKPNI